jgi:hypothetical protein
VTKAVIYDVESMFISQSKNHMVVLLTILRKKQTAIFCRKLHRCADITHTHPNVNLGEYAYFCS